MNAPSRHPAKFPHLLDGPAQYRRGVDHLLGHGGVQPDLGIAIACFLNAAACAEAGGLYSAGMMYLRGIGVMGNPKLGLGLLEAAAAQSHPSAARVLQAVRNGGDVGGFPIVALEEPAPTAAWAASSRLWGRTWKMLRTAPRAAATVASASLQEHP